MPSTAGFATGAEKRTGPLARPRPTLDSSHSSAAIGRTRGERRPTRAYGGRERDSAPRPRSADQLRQMAADAANQAPAAALGSSGNVIPSGSDDTTPSVVRHRRTLERVRLRDRARTPWRIAGQLDDGDDFRTTRLCGLVPLDGFGGIEVRQRIDGQLGADIVGTMSCGSANAVCPVCTARVREKRRREIAELVERGQSQGYRFVFVTGTLRHTRETRPAQQRKALEACWRAVTQGRAAQDRKNCGQVAGTVRAIEFMLEGPAGPHGHVHAIVAVAPNVTARGLMAAMDAMGETWCTWAERNMDGLRPDDAHGWAWEVARNADDVAKYVVKLVDGDDWNITHEVTRGDAKRGTGGSVTPLELLDRAVTEFETTGDVRLMLRMAEYARAVKGMRSIVVSRSFRELFAAVEDAEPAEPDIWKTVAIVPLEAWNYIARRHGVGIFIHAAARHGAAGIAAILEDVPGMGRGGG